MKRIVIISATIVCAALIGLAVAAGPGSIGWHRSPEERVAHIASEIADLLALDDAQKSTLDRIADEIIAEHQQIHDDHDTFKAGLKELFVQEQVSAEELKAHFDTKKSLIEELMQLASQHMAEFHSVLTPEQRATLIAEIESHQGRRCRFAH